jgi:hypothetical protein
MAAALVVLQVSWYSNPKIKAEFLEKNSRK